MILIIGGAFQGKLDFAMKRFGAAGDDVYTCSEDCAELKSEKRIIYGYHRLVLAQMRQQLDSLGFIDENAFRLRDCIIIADDISCGVVPVDEERRLWRENVGRTLNYLAKNSDEVYRIFCGLEMKLK